MVLKISTRSKREGGHPHKRKRKGIPEYSLKTTINLDKKAWEILEQLKAQSPSKKSYSQLIRYCIKKAGNTMRILIMEKINEHDTKADWWREQLKFYEEKRKRLKEA